MSGMRYSKFPLTVLIAVLGIVTSVACVSADEFSDKSSADNPTSSINIKKNDTSVPPASETNDLVTTPAGTSDIFERYLGTPLESFSIEPSLTTYFVKGDRGRFRQDWNVDDRTTGGVQDIRFTKKQGDVSLEFEGRDLINYDYLAHLRVSKENGHYFDAEWKSFRKYWDGSQDKPWDPAAYNLPAQFQDWDDEELHTNRGNANFEYGYPLSEQAKIILGYQLWTREGRETLLRGEDAVRASLPTLRSIPVRRRVDGVSHTVSVRVPFTVGEIHNIEPGISFEAYRDSHFTNSLRYTNGALVQQRDYIEKPQFNDLQLQLKYDSFLSDDVYVHGGYFFNYLRNDSVQSEQRPNLANPNTYVNPDVNNYRVSNVFSIGSALLNFLRQKGLDARLGFRGEHATTDAHGTLTDGSDATTNPFRTSDTALGEGWFAEAVSLTYRGLARTTAFMGLDMEQRRLDWNETFDAKSHETFTTFGSGNPNMGYETKITYIDFVPKVKLTHRLNSAVKLFAGYRWQEKERQYNTQFDTHPGYYPGHLGDQERRVHEVTTSANVRLPAGWASILKYQMVADNIEFPKVGDGQQDMDRDRFTVSFSGPLAQKLFVYIAGMYDYYRVNTPAFGPGTSRWGWGEGAYDFNGDVYITSTNLNYQLTKNVSTFASYQFTNSLGDNQNTLNEAATGFRYNVNKTSSFEARYQVFKFNDDRGVEDFDDDYFGQGMSFAFKKALG